MSSVAPAKKEEAKPKPKPPPLKPKPEVIESQSHTDVLFLFVFIMFLFGMFVLWGVGYYRGDARRLILPFDYEGNMCGVNNLQHGGRDLSGLPVLAWFDTHDYSSQICVAKCTSEQNSTDALGYFEPSDIYGVKGHSSQRYMRYPDVKVMSRCIPQDLSTASEDFQRLAVSSSSAHFVNDVERSYWMVFLVLPWTAFLCILHLYFLRVFAKEMIWVTVFLSVALVTGASIWCLLQGLGAMSDVSPAMGPLARAFGAEARFHLLITGCLLSVLAFSLVVFICFFGSRISLVGVMMEETGKVLTQMPSIVLFPIVPLLLALGFLALWSFFTPYLASAQSIDLSKDVSIHVGQTRTGTMDTSLKFALVYNLFGLFWVMLFILGVTKVTIAGGVSTWYFAEFSKDKDGNKKKHLPNGVLSSFFWRTLKYQSGSVALGAFLILVTAVFNWIARVSIYMASRQTKLPIIKYFLACLLCLFEAVFKIISLVSHYAYIEMAFWSDGYCASARRVAARIERNFAKVAVVDLVGDFVLFLCKLNVTFLTGYVLTLVMRIEQVATYLALYEPHSMVILSMLVAFPIASCFFGIYEVGIDTVLLSFIVESDEDSTEYMPDDLKEFIEHHERLFNDKRSSNSSSKEKESK
eukprot:c12318_g1_i1.p1 GENE.c12318_g1_i1~~c12318_g1_i1.p1  ORF type:complete len:659 (+),score=135.55 c12318_g1_i1:68-1978(+)